MATYIYSKLFNSVAGEWYASTSFIQIIQIYYLNEHTSETYSNLIQIETPLKGSKFVKM